MKVNLSFFASGTVFRYMARLLVTRSCAVLGALTLVLTALDLLGESGDILAYPGNGDTQLWYYVSLRLPQIVARFLPFSVLLGSLIMLAGMNQNSEIISMKAAGISAHQIVAPLIATSLMIAGLSFWFDDHVVARATGVLSAWQDVDYGPVPPRHGLVSNVWVRDGEDLIHVDRVNGRGGGATLAGISYYDRQGARLAAIATAERGVRDGRSWKLLDVRRFDVASGRITVIPSMLVGSDVAPDRFTLASVNGDALSFRALARAIQELKAAGRPTAGLETVKWHKISGALSTVLMPLLAGVAGFGLARSGAVFLRVVIGMALGFTYFVADNFALAMGNIGAYPPLLAAWAPFLLFLLIGEAVLIRTEE